MIKDTTSGKEKEAMSGVEAVPRIKAVCPQTEIIMLTGFEKDERVIIDAIISGASGFCDKDPDIIIMRAIKEASEYGFFIMPRIQKRLLNMLHNFFGAPSENTYGFTRTERRILEALIKVSSDEDEDRDMSTSVGDILEIVPDTAKTHFSRIYGINGKFGVRHQCQAIVKGIFELKIGLKERFLGRFF